MSAEVKDSQEGGRKFYLDRNPLWVGGHLVARSSPKDPLPLPYARGSPRTTLPLTKHIVEYNIGVNLSLGGKQADMAKIVVKNAMILLPLVLLVACGGAPTPTATPPATDCHWNWNRQSLTELSEQVQVALNAAGIPGATAYATAYGEDCIDPETNTVRDFVAMETDFYVTLPVGDLADLDALGNLTAEVLAVLDGFPPDSTPGPQPGYIGITFVVGEEELNFRFTVEQAADARKRGLTGADLLEPLGYPP